MASFEFFRKHQKFVLYTAGFFALLTFSITGAMTSFFDNLTGSGYIPATLRLADGRTAYVTQEDRRIGQALADRHRMVLPQLVPQVGGPRTSEGDEAEILAAVRRLAIEYGIEPSPTEVAAAVDHALSVAPKREGGALEKADLVARSGLSADQYDLLMRESMRIATFLRMFAFAADATDAELAEEIAREMKLITFKVASLDKKQIEERLKQTEVTDDELKAWLAELPDNEKIAYQDTNRVGVKAAGVEMESFDPAAFAAELAGKEYDDQTVTERYNLDRDLYYRKEVKEGEPAPEDPYLPLAEVRDQVVRRLQAEDALKAVLGKLRLQMGDALREAVDARNEATKDLAAKRAAQAEADKKAAEKPDDEALKKAAEDAKAAVAAAEKLLEERNAALDAARRAFDLEAELAKATTGKLQIATIAEPGNADALKDLPVFGPWDASWAATSIDLPGDLCTRIQHTKKGAFLFQVLDVVKNPLKDFDKIRDTLREDYYKKKADTEAKETLKKFEDALERLAREAKKAEIEKLEGDLAATVQRKYDEWLQTAREKLEVARQRRDELQRDPQSKPYKRWQEEFERLERELGAAEDKRKEFEAAEKQAVDEQIAKLIKETRKDVLDAAAAEAGLVVETIGPVRRDADTLPRFDEDWPARERFLLRNFTVKELKEGEATDLLEDFTNRAHHMVVMQKIEPGSVDLVTRRELAAKRAQFRARRAVETVARSFTLEALRKGWGYRSTTGEPDEAKAARRDTTSGEKAASTDKR